MPHLSLLPTLICTFIQVCDAKHSNAAFQDSFWQLQDLKMILYTQFFLDSRMTHKKWKIILMNRSEDKPHVDAKQYSQYNNNDNNNNKTLFGPQWFLVHNKTQFMAWKFETKGRIGKRQLSYIGYDNQQTYNRSCLTADMQQWLLFLCSRFPEPSQGSILKAFSWLNMQAPRSEALSVSLGSWGDT